MNLPGTLNAAATLMPGLATYGVGGGIVATSLIGLTLSGVSPKDAGAASGSILTAAQVSQAVGIAGIGALFAALTSGYGPANGFALALAVLTVLSLTTLLLLHRLVKPFSIR